MSLLCQLQMTLPGGFPGVLGVTVRMMSDREFSQLVVGTKQMIPLRAPYVEIASSLRSSQ